MQPTPNSIEIPFGDLMKQANDLFPIMIVFLPFLLIGITWGLSRRILYLLRPDLFTGEKRKNDQVAEGESRKLKKDELPWIEDEKPKRQPRFELRDDGEIFEIIDED